MQVAKGLLISTTNDLREASMVVKGQMAKALDHSMAKDLRTSTIKDPREDLMEAKGPMVKDLKEVSMEIDHSMAKDKVKNSSNRIIYFYW